MKRFVTWFPIAALTFIFGISAVAFLIRGSGLPNCVINLQQPAGKTTPTSKREEIAEIYRAVLSEEGAVGFLHQRIGEGRAFLVHEDARNVPTPLSKRFVKRLRELGADSEALSNIRRPVEQGGTIRRHLRLLPGLVLGVDGTPHVFDNKSDSWVRTELPRPYAGLISLSDVVYNKDRSHAIVRFGVACGSYCGESGFCVLRKNGETWQIVGILDLYS